MDVNAVTQASGATNQSTTDSSLAAATVDYDSFLKLLVAEMQNQDPTNPMDSTEYISQLASFSSVEQAIQTNARLDRLLITNALSQANGLIGRTLTSGDGSISGEVTSVRLTDNQTIAILADGTELTLGSGVTIR